MNYYESNNKTELALVLGVEDSGKFSRILAKAKDIPYKQYDEALISKSLVTLLYTNDSYCNCFVFQIQDINKLTRLLLSIPVKPEYTQLIVTAYKLSTLLLDTVLRYNNLLKDKGVD